MLIDGSLKNYQTSSLIRFGLFPGEIKVFVAAPTHLNLKGEKRQVDESLCQPYEFRIRGGRLLAGKVFPAMILKGTEYIPVHADTAVRHRDWYLTGGAGLYLRPVHVELIRNDAQEIRGFGSTAAIPTSIFG